MNITKIIFKGTIFNVIGFLILCVKGFNAIRFTNDLEKIEIKYVLATFLSNEIIDDFCNTDKETIIGICDLIFKTDEYEKLGVYLNKAAAYALEPNCIEVNLKINKYNLEKEITKLNQKITPCYGRHYPLRTHWITDDYFETFFISKGLEENSLFIYERRKTTETDFYSLHELANDIYFENILPITITEQEMVEDIQSITIMSFNTNIEEIEINYIREFVKKDENLRQTDKLINLATSKILPLCRRILDREPYNEKYILAGDIFDTFPVMTEGIKKSVLFKYATNYNSKISRLRVFPCYVIERDEIYENVEKDYNLIPIYLSSGYRENSMLVLVLEQKKMVFQEFIENIYISDLSSEDCSFIVTENLQEEITERSIVPVQPYDEDIPIYFEQESEESESYEEEYEDTESSTSEDIPEISLSMSAVQKKLAWKLKERSRQLATEISPASTSKIEDEKIIKSDSDKQIIIVPKPITEIPIASTSRIKDKKTIKSDSDKQIIIMPKPITEIPIASTSEIKDKKTIKSDSDKQIIIMPKPITEIPIASTSEIKDKKIIKSDSGKQTIIMPELEQKKELPKLIKRKSVSFKDTEKEVRTFEKSPSESDTDSLSDTEIDKQEVKLEELTSSDSESDSDIKIIQLGTSPTEQEIMLEKSILAQQTFAERKLQSVEQELDTLKKNQEKIASRISGFDQPSVVSETQPRLHRTSSITEPSSTRKGSDVLGETQQKVTTKEPVLARHTSKSKSKYDILETTDPITSQSFEEESPDVLAEFMASRSRSFMNLDIIEEENNSDLSQPQTPVTELENVSMRYPSLEKEKNVSRFVLTSESSIQQGRKSIRDYLTSPSEDLQNIGGSESLDPRISKSFESSSQSPLEFPVDIESQNISTEYSTYFRQSGKTSKKGFLKSPKETFKKMFSLKKSEQQGETSKPKKKKKKKKKINKKLQFLRCMPAL